MNKMQQLVQYANNCWKILIFYVSIKTKNRKIRKLKIQHDLLY